MMTLADFDKAVEHFKGVAKLTLQNSEFHAPILVGFKSESEDQTGTVVMFQGDGDLSLAIKEIVNKQDLECFVFIAEANIKELVLGGEPIPGEALIVYSFHPERQACTAIRFARENKVATILGEKTYEQDELGGQIIDSFGVPKTLH